MHFTISCLPKTFLAASNPQAEVVICQKSQTRRGLRHGNVLWLFAVMMLAAAGQKASGAAVAVDQFTEITNARYINVGVSQLTTIVSGGITITPSRIDVSNGYGNYTAGTPANPADGNGYCTDRSVILNFSAPLAAFGVTFYHSYYLPSWWGTIYPATLEVYDGLNGTGQIIGSITSSGAPQTVLGHPDFVAIWSDAVNIRSALLIGTGTPPGFGVDSYGLSLVPIPEPSSLAILAVGIVFGWSWRRRNKRLPSDRDAVLCRNRLALAFPRQGRDARKRRRPHVA